MIPKAIQKRLFFDGLARHWHSENTLDQNDLKLLRDCLSPIELGQGEMVLDLGGGTGRLTEYLCRTYGLRCLVLDVSYRMLKEGWGRLPRVSTSWLQADGHHLPLRSESIKHIFCFCAFPHFDCQENALKECRRVLQPGGALLVIHNSGREEINRFHSSQNKIIASDYLPSLDHFREWGRSFNWERKRLEDGEGGFIIHFRKP